MRDLLAQIEGAIGANSYYLALYAGLTIPDICDAMESENGQANKTKYTAWFDKYVGGHYVVCGNPTFTGEVCYFYRCSVLHQGRAQHPKLGYSRIIFVEPGATTNVFHNNVLNDALNIDVSIFCKQLVEGARKWLKEQEKSVEYARNFAQFMQRHPGGLAPYIVGVPVIA